MHAPRMSALCLIGLAAIGAGTAAADSIDQGSGQTTVARAKAAPALKESAIASRVKARLAARHLATQVTVRVNADRDGIIWLSGTVSTLDAAAQATQAAMETDGVVAVHNAIIVQ